MATKAELDLYANLQGDAAGKMDDLSGKAGGLNVGMLALGGAVLGVGAALTDSVGKAAEFDQQMAAIKATSDDGGASIDKLRQLALDLGMANDVGAVSASDAAGAILELNKAGISAEDQLGGVTKSVLQLAAASGGDMGVADAASLASDAMATFGMEADDMSGIVDNLVGAANASTIGLTDLKFGLSAAGSVAAAVGMDFEDTATALALFGQNGLKGSDAWHVPQNHADEPEPADQQAKRSDARARAMDRGNRLSLLRRGGQYAATR